MLRIVYVVLERDPNGGHQVWSQSFSNLGDAKSGVQKAAIHQPLRLVIPSFVRHPACGDTWMMDDSAITGYCWTIHATEVAS